MSDTEKRHGRSIRVFLVDGTTTGLVIAEVVNWTGKAIVVPRSALGQFLRRPEASETGVYILAGPDPDNPFRPTVYIGEAEEVGARLRQHDRDESKDFFEQAIVFISKDENLTKAHARWLESKLIVLVGGSDRATIANGNGPSGSSLPEADRSDMDYFLSQMAIILPVLGLDILRPVPSRLEAAADNVATYVFSGEGYSAEAQEIDGEMIVRTGSMIRLRETQTCPDRTKRLRAEAVQRQDMVLSEAGDSFQLAKDQVFSSPSGAAAFVYGGSVNGQTAWKERHSLRTYGELRQANLSETQ